MLNETFIPLQKNTIPTLPIAFDAKLQLTQIQSPYPFFSIKNEENIVNLLIDAAYKNKTEDARKYISKYYVDQIDLCNFYDYFDGNVSYKLIQRIDFNSAPKNCCTNSIVFFDNNDKIMNIINLHLICEPDSVSKWKIYALDQE